MSNNNKKNKLIQPTYDLAILCQFQNEELRLRAWLHHHIWQGVQHFFLIDDNSSDNSKEVLQEFIDNGIITYFTRSGSKVDNYRWLFDKIKGKAKWIAVCDVNEYFYGVNKKLVKALKQINPQLNIILCNKFCYKCENDNEFENPACNAFNRHSLLSKPTKYIFRVKSVIDKSQIWLECLLFPKSKIIMTKHPKTFISNSIIRLNHYERYVNNSDDINDVQYLCDTTLKDLIQNTPNDY
jgi:glycosyltransferase involved in cell wall biosynthesis